MVDRNIVKNPILDSTLHFFRSIKYIDELQKFVEDDQWKRSMRIEPDDSGTQTNSNNAKESVQLHPNLMAELNLSPAKGMLQRTRICVLILFTSGKIVPPPTLL